MIRPEDAAYRFGMACLIGCILGLIYGFLRPLRPRLTHIADGIFVLAALWGWIVLGFGICRGDLRVGYTAGMAVGTVLWETTAGKWLRPFFRSFWNVVKRILTAPWYLCKKIFQKFGVFVKKLFAIHEKSGTIK